MNRATLARRVYRAGTAITYAGLAMSAAFPVLMVATWSGAVAVADYVDVAPALLAAMVAGQAVIALGCHLWTRADDMALRARIAGVR